MDAVATVTSFSFLDLFLKADWIVKAVMIGLALASVWSWAVAIDKWLQIRKLEAGARIVEAALAEGRGIDAIEESAKPGDAMARVVAVGMAEARLARRIPNQTEIGLSRAIERMERVMQAATAREMARAERGLAILATIGSSAPFVGLFGTVWGIMNAFRGIAQSRDTNLAVVAPGIAEALFATALGLLAAIPAVIFYNWLAGSLDRFATRLDALSDDVIARVSRRLQDPN
ncbi:MAG: MotA/TolQ/ExbB proton channel family protein [Hyphomonadaceae bacterium]|jgi:biopolymer transport protein TolQ|uniref:MotA/TolQ/ExbB proton channel family protein n=1 Tax=Aquidulcibacter sp. TaxID=2052990 RepID=UPI0022C21597|nr:MotA/TolQ/ExbB proton channel family protein [Aquidulcibacter sp.]MCE2889595.1 MotA/TolQ/ExbB proton channel family protein [Hyphomonadaceae bacterium]MCZ8209203.1 MotA/TolQ/ExbB proton channel family protein [Aquidulcibacter sp.]